MGRHAPRLLPRTLHELFLLTQPARVLLADESSSSRVPLAAALRRDGYEVVEAVERSELETWVGRPAGSPTALQLPDLIIANLELFGGSGLELLSQLRAAQRRTPVILLSSHADARELQRAEQLGAAWVFEKAAGIEDVRIAALSLVDPS